MLRFALLGMVAAIIGGLMLPPTRTDCSEGAPTEKAMAAAARKFHKNCQHCHQPPDLRFESDRAWLDQLKRTA